MPLELISLACRVQTVVATCGISEVFWVVAKPKSLVVQKSKVWDQYLCCSLQHPVSDAI